MSKKKAAKKPTQQSMVEACSALRDEYNELVDRNSDLRDVIASHITDDKSGPETLQALINLLPLDWAVESVEYEAQGECKEYIRLCISRPRPDAATDGDE